MKVGIFTGLTDETFAPVSFGRAVEASGFESFFVADHSHIPVKRETPYPYSHDGSLARSNYRVLDPLVTLAVIAATTTSLRLGIGVALAAQRDPIQLAKEVATLDWLSNGRVEFGVGSGWLREEMRNHGTDPAHRVAVLGERVRAMKVIWEQEEAEFHGKFVDFDPIYSWPKPVQRPHPPVLVGGWGPTTLSRVLDYGDAWMTPVGLSLAELREGMAELQRLADERGCSVPLVTTTKLAAEPSTRAEYEDLGVDRLLIAVSGASSDSALAELRAASSLL